MVAKSGEPLTAPAHAPGYLDTLHATCQECHQVEAAARGKPELGECGACHQDMPANSLQVKHSY